MSLQRATPRHLQKHIGAGWGARPGLCNFCHTFQSRLLWTPLLQMTICAQVKCFASCQARGAWSQCAYLLCSSGHQAPTVYQAWPSCWGFSHKQNRTKLLFFRLSCSTRVTDNKWLVNHTKSWKMIKTLGKNEAGKKWGTQF